MAPYRPPEGTLRSLYNDLSEIIEKGLQACEVVDQILSAPKEAEDSADSYIL